MVAILSWGRDLIFQPVDSIQKVHDMKHRMDLPDTDYIIHDSVFLCPIKMDNAVKEQTESEILEWKMSYAYPKLVEEGRMIKNNGRYRPLNKNREKHGDKV
jgi:hypothetical protein